MSLSLSLSCVCSFSSSYVAVSKLMKHSGATLVLYFNLNSPNVQPTHHPRSDSTCIGDESSVSGDYEPWCRGLARISCAGVIYFRIY